MVRLDLPKTRESFLARDACVLAGRLYIGTEKSGLLMYDPQAATWKTYGAEEGLPGWTICHLHILDDKTLLCVGGERFRETLIYTLEIDTEQITLFRRVPGRDKPVWSTFHIWRDGERVMGAYRDGLAEDLLKPRGAFLRWPTATPAGWPCTYWFLRSGRAAVVKGRRFISSSDGIREINSAGKVLRAWSKNTTVTLPEPFYEAPFYNELVEPGMLPGLVPGRCGDYVARTRLLSHDDAHLFFKVDRPPGLICYDVEADTWYGPVKVAIEFFESARMYDPKGVWLRNEEVFLHLATADVIAAARNAGLVVTDSDLRRRRLALFDAAPPLDAAKLTIGSRQFDQAKSILAGILTVDPANAEALLLMGFVHDRYCLNRPEVALDYYGRLAALSQPQAAVAGLYCRYVLQIRRKNWPEALRLGQQIVEDFRIQKVYRDDIVRKNSEIAKAVKSAKK
jgi:hypothetical protein